MYYHQPKNTDISMLNSSLSDYDLSETRLPSNTTFKQFIQLLLEKNFPLISDLVVNGVVNVDFDSTIYVRNSSYYAGATQWVYEAGKLLYHNILSTNLLSVGYGTKNKINFVKYNKLTVVGRGTQNQSFVTKELDISNINVEAYLIISICRTSSALTEIVIYICTDKNNYETNSLVSLLIATSDNTNASAYAQIDTIKLT